MPTASARALIAICCLLGLLVQTVGGGSGTLGALCVGCERVGWAIRTPSHAEEHKGCCSEDDADHEESSEGAPNGRKSCRCIEVPLTTGVTLSAMEPRGQTDSEVILAGPAPASMSALVESLLPRFVKSGVGPEPPPWTPAPLARRTVLVL